MFRFLSFLLLLPVIVHAGPGEWPEPRQNPRLTGIQKMAAGITTAPSATTRFDLGRSVPPITPVVREGFPERALAVVNGALHCFDTAGATLWKTHPRGLNFTRVEVVDDLDGDGDLEALLQAGRPTEPFGAATLVDVESGELLWRYDVEPMSYAWYLYADDYFEQPGTKQIAVVMHGYPPDEKDGYMALFDFADKGAAPVQAWRYDFDDYTCFPSLLRSDVDGDGKRELIIETHSRMWIFDATTGEKKQFVQWDVAPANVRSYGKVEFIDLDKDGDEDFLCIATFAQHHEVLLNENGELKKAWHVGWGESVTTGKVDTVHPEPPYADLDGDGNLELVLSVFNGEGDAKWVTRVYDPVTGNIEARYEGGVAVAVEDLEADGAAEIAMHLTTDPAQAMRTAARVVKWSGGEWTTFWEYPTATLAAAPKSATGLAFLVSRPDQPAALLTQEGEEFSESPVPERGPKPKDQFKSRPAVGSGAFPEILSADLTGDGRMEMVLYRQPKAEVFRVEPDGAWSLIETFESTGLPVLADIDEEKGKEVVVATTGLTEPPKFSVWSLREGKKLVWEKQIPPTDRAGLPNSRKLYMRTAHFTGRPQHDLFAWVGEPVVRSLGLDGRNGEILWEKGECDGIERFDGPSMNLASTFDLNNDGTVDLVFTNPDYYTVADGVTGKNLLGPLYPPTIFNQPSQGLYTFPAILSGSAGSETIVCLVAGHYFQAAMSPMAKPAWYKLPVCGEARSAVEGFLQTKDGEWLMGFGRQNGKFACVNVGDGSLRWELDLGATCSDTLTLDVDGDGSFEFVVGTSHGDLVAIGDGGDAPREVWRASLPGAVGNPIAADVDGDGASEIVVPVADGSVKVIDTAR